MLTLFNSTNTKNTLPMETQMADEKFKGTASCTITKKDGTTTSISASCFAEASYESAKSALEAKIKAEASAQSGEVQGSISFSISKEF